MRRFKIMFLVALSLGILFFFFLLAERFRGRIALERYKRKLIAMGEILSARDFARVSTNEDNGDREIAEAMKRLKEGGILPKNYPPKMRVTPAGECNCRISRR